MTPDNEQRQLPRSLTLKGVLLTKSWIIKEIPSGDDIFIQKQRRHKA